MGTISEQDAPSDSAALASASETNVSEAAEVEIASTPETAGGSVATEEIDSKRSETDDVSSAEDNMDMAEMDMETLLSATDHSFETVSEGRVIPGTIVRKK